VACPTASNPYDLEVRLPSLHSTSPVLVGCVVFVYTGRSDRQITGSRFEVFIRAGLAVVRAGKSVGSTISGCEVYSDLTFRVHRHSELEV
jgi:hypothetical protein